MRTAAVFLSLMQAQDLPELYARAAEGAMAHLGAEGAYLLRLEAGRYRVVGAAGTAGLARGLRLPPEWEPREGTTPPPGPLGFSPDGKRRLGHMARRGSLVLALEGVGPLGEEKEVLEALLEAVALREGRMAGLSTLEVLLSLSRRLRQGASLAEEIRGALEVLLERTGLEVGVR